MWPCVDVQRRELLTMERRTIDLAGARLDVGKVSKECDLGDRHSGEFVFVPSWFEVGDVVARELLRDGE